MLAPSTVVGARMWASRPTPIRTGDTASSVGRDFVLNAPGSDDAWPRARAVG